MIESGLAAAEPVLSWPQTLADFDALIEATQRRLVHFAFCRLRSLADAEDVVQNVYVRAYRDRERHRNVDNAVPFLFRMVANESIDVLRRRRKGASAFSASPAGSPDCPAESAERQEWVEHLLSQLPARQAAVLRLRFYCELPFDAVARTMGCSVPTVKSRFRYGIEKIRKLLDRQGGVR